MAKLTLGDSSGTPAIVKIEEVPKTKFGASVDTWIGDVDENGVLNRPTWTGTLNFAGVKTIGARGLQHAFYYRSGISSGITSVVFGSLQSVGERGLYYSFHTCSNITSIDLSSLQSVGDEGMYSAFSYCHGITSVVFDSLQSVKYFSLASTFQDCRSLTTVSFPALTDVESASFGSASYNATFQSCSKLTEIHFRADMQATIEAVAVYADKFGARNATIYFDL